MTYKYKAAVVGCHIAAPVTEKGEALEELLYRVVQAALKDAGMTIEDIEGIVVAANDQFDGRAISVMAASGSVGGVNRDILSTPSASEHAFVMAALRVGSGQYDTQLIVSWSPTEVDSFSEAERLAADPYFHRRLPLDETSANALQATALEARRQDLAAAVNALAGEPGASVRWPLTRDMLPAPQTGVVALVLASEDYVSRHGMKDVAWVKGIGWATEPAFLGDRDLATAPALASAVERAYGEAGISQPESAFDVAEVADATPYQKLMAIEGLGLLGKAGWQGGAAARFAADGDMPVNPSGGAQKGANAVFCNGLIRIAEAANQVRGRAARQVAGARRALAQAASGFAMQYQTVVVFGQQSDKGE